MRLLLAALLSSTPAFADIEEWNPSLVFPPGMGGPPLWAQPDPLEPSKEHIECVQRSDGLVNCVTWRNGQVVLRAVCGRNYAGQKVCNSVEH